MLDERLPDDLRDRKKENKYEEKFKTILEGKSNNEIVKNAMQFISTILLLQRKAEIILKYYQKVGFK